EVGLGPRGGRPVPGEDGVAVLDLPVALQHRLGEDDGLAVAAAVPLEVADPEHEVGDGGGAGVDLDPAELRGGDAEPLADGLADEALGDASGLVFEGLQPGERDVEEVAGAAGGVEDADGGEAGEEAGEGASGLVAEAGALAAVPGLLGPLDELLGGGPDGLPLLAERFEDGGADEALDVGAGGEV